MKSLICSVMALLVAGHCFAQAPDSKSPEHFFKLDLVVKELEAGKIVSSHNYSTPIEVGGKSSIRMGDKVKIDNYSGGFSWTDVGVNIDCQLTNVTSSGLTLHIVADISGVVAPDKGTVISSAKWNADVIIPLRKATTVFSSDSPSSKRQMQLEVTATPIQ